jgi:Domain of unknown function (DUF4440)
LIPVDADLLRGIELTRLRSLVDGDIEAADGFHAEDYQLITPRGHALSKAEYLGSIAAKELHYSVFVPTSPMEVWGDDHTAVIRYRVRIAFHNSSAAPLECWHTDCYRNTNGHWQVVSSQATEIRND